jgi:hypothetical protein
MPIEAEPEAEPEPAPAPPTVVPALIDVSGSALWVKIVNAVGESFDVPGAVPPGKYSVLVSFVDGQRVHIKGVQFQATSATSHIVHCSKDFLSCSAK